MARSKKQKNKKQKNENVLSINSCFHNNYEFKLVWRKWIGCFDNFGWKGGWKGNQDQDWNDAVKFLTNFFLGVGSFCVHTQYF